MVSQITQAPWSFSGDLRWVCSIWAQVSQISGRQIKAPTGSVFQKYVYSNLIVKMRIILGSFGLFWFILGWGSNLSNLNFWVKKFKFGSAEKMGCGCRNGSTSQKVQIFGKRSILMKCGILYGGLRGSIQFLIFEHFYMVFR